MIQRIAKLFQKLFYRKARKEQEEKIWQYLELAYEIRKNIYEYNCRMKEYVRKNRREGQWYPLGEEVLYFELVFSIQEKKLFQKIGLDVEALIRNFEINKMEKFLVEKEYGKTKLELTKKGILSGDIVFKYRIYSVIHKKSFETVKQCDIESKERMGKEIDFYGYFLSS